MITFCIDELTPCLKDVVTGDILDTEVVALKRKSFLSKFNKKTGWYVNWGKMPQDIEIYALVLKGTVDVQGLIALKNDTDANAVYIHWACTAPHNNIWEHNKQKYIGVGGHLLAIAVQKSIEWEHAGVFHADAMDEKLLKHYIEKFNAWSMPISNRPFHFVVEEESAQRLREVYTYDWSEEEL